MKTRWSSGSLGTTQQTLVSCKNNSRATIDMIVVSNTGGSTTTYDIYQVPKNDSASTGNAIGYQVSIGSKRFVIIEGPMYLIEGDRLIVQAGSAASLTITAYGNMRE